MQDVERIRGVRVLVDQVTKMAMWVELEDATELVNLNNHMETVLPFMDPTSFMDNADNIRIRDRQFRAFLNFRRELEEIKKDVRIVS